MRFSSTLEKFWFWTGTWTIDNIVVTSQEVPYTWLTFNSSSTGTVPASSTEAISYTFDATGLALGDYTSTITVTSNDEDEPSTDIPVTFTVTNAPPPLTTPENVVASIVGANLVIDWDDSSPSGGYNVYSSDDPYGTFGNVVNVGTNQYIILAGVAKMFYQICATDSKFAAPKTIEVIKVAKIVKLVK